MQGRAAANWRSFDSVGYLHPEPEYCLCLSRRPATQVFEIISMLGSSN
ncbi:hypothetical protein S884_002220 [Salmonella enterica subsp. diarizonae]|nr:hypothetical protein [Salmonella enterica subsp. diarizonae]